MKDMIAARVRRCNGVIKRDWHFRVDVGAWIVSIDVFWGSPRGDYLERNINEDGQKKDWRGEMRCGQEVPLVSTGTSRYNILQYPDRSPSCESTVERPMEAAAS